MNRQEALNKKLDACINVSNWAIDNGFDAVELWMAWNEWLEELKQISVGDYLSRPRRGKRGVTGSACSR
jgi:hypothetical protein